jgi:xylulokinase
MVVDLGTTNIKGQVFDATGKEVAVAVIPQGINATQPGWAEQDAAAWLGAAKKVIADAVSQVDAAAVRAITVTNQQVSTVPVDADGNPLDAAILWMDTRTKPIIERVASRVDPDRIRRTTGIALTTSWAALRPLWWREYKPEVFAATDKFLTADAFLNLHLAGECVSDYSNACFGAFAVDRREWDEGLCEEIGLPVERLPRVVPPGVALGKVREALAEEVGLSPDTVVVAGASDQPCAALGLNVVDTGSVAATIGTGTFVVLHTEDPIIDPRFFTNCAGLPDRWLLFGVHYVSGALLEWVAANVFDGAAPSEISSAAAQSEPGAEGLLCLPYFQGARTPFFDDRARGVFYGLTLHHDRSQIARATLESTAFGVRQAVAGYEGLGKRVESIRLGGGGSKSDVWCQIHADVTGVPVVRTEEPDSTGLGAALLALTEAGIHATVADAAEACVRVNRTFEPNQEAGQIYQRSFEAYEELYRALRDRFREDFE